MVIDARAASKVDFDSGRNHAPVLSGANTFTSYTSVQTVNNGDRVSTLIAGQVSDSDSNALAGIAVIGLTSGNGDWQYSTDDGSNWTDVGTVTSSAALLLRDCDRLRFVPDGLSGTTGSVTFCAWDQTSGSAGTKVNASSRGGSTPFSVAVAVSTIHGSGETHRLVMASDRPEPLVESITDYPILDEMFLVESDVFPLWSNERQDPGKEDVSERLGDDASAARLLSPQDDGESEVLDGQLLLLAISQIIAAGLLKQNSEMRTTCSGRLQSCNS